MTHSFLLRSHVGLSLWSGRYGFVAQALSLWICRCGSVCPVLVTMGRSL